MGHFLRQNPKLWDSYPRGVWINVDLLPNPREDHEGTAKLKFDLIVKTYDAKDDKFIFSRNMHRSIIFVHPSEAENEWKWGQSDRNERVVAFFIHPDWRDVYANQTIETYAQLLDVNELGGKHLQITIERAPNGQPIPPEITAT